MAYFSHRKLSACQAYGNKSLQRSFFFFKGLPARTEYTARYTGATNSGASSAGTGKYQDHQVIVYSELLLQHFFIPPQTPGRQSRFMDSASISRRASQSRFRAPDLSLGDTEDPGRAISSRHAGRFKRGRSESPPIEGSSVSMLFKIQPAKRPKKSRDKNVRAISEVGERGTLWWNGGEGCRAARAV